MSGELIKKGIDAAAIEKVITAGDLSRLTAGERVQYYKAVCESMGLNWLTKPFGYIAFKNGELKLYALKDCTEQLRRIYKVSVGMPEKIDLQGCIAFRVSVSNAEGRADSGIGAVAADNLRGEALANAAMKAETKAKRRATLSICGLGFLDETEVSSIEGAKIVDENYTQEPTKAEVKALPVKSGPYYYDTSKITDTDKRIELEEWFHASNCKTVAPSIFECSIDSKKLAHIKVPKPEVLPGSIKNDELPDLGEGY